MISFPATGSYTGVGDWSSYVLNKARGIHASGHVEMPVLTKGLPHQNVMTSAERQEELLPPSFMLIYPSITVSSHEVWSLQQLWGYAISHQVCRVLYFKSFSSEGTADSEIAPGETSATARNKAPPSEENGEAVKSTWKSHAEAQIFMYLPAERAQQRSLKSRRRKQLLGLGRDCS